ncbi:MAG: cation-translocating P-type ATPase [Promethearchaeota archaeon]|nr:MAG: cation-translocating P-type ATPase [Candidatus Lokiarchaeota archaeon]
MQSSINKNYYYKWKIEDLATKFNTDVNQGLKLSSIESSYEKFGHNELPKIKKSLWKIYLAPIFNFLIVILIISGFLVLILGSPSSTYITFTVVMLNSITVIIQQYRAQKALESLRRIAALKANVIRDGIHFEIPTREIVPGDIILIEQGDKIAADARIITLTNLTMEEASLTGESEPVEKEVKTLSKSELPIQKQVNMLFMGTYVHSGRAKALVIATGANTQIGRISRQLNEMGSVEDIPLTRKLNRLAYILGSIVIINLCVLITYKMIVLALANQLFGPQISEALVTSILRSMNVMPINLPILTTLVLVTGVLNMAQNGVIVKNLAAIESLGRVSIICSDKTGTITRNEMTVEYFWINNQEYTVTGIGFEADGKILNTAGDEINLKTNKTFQRFIDSCVLNNNSQLVYEDVPVKLKNTKQIAVRKALGLPTESALLVLAEKANFSPYDIKAKFEKRREFPFNSEIKRMTTICQSKSNAKSCFVFTKGAPEKILEISSKFEIDGEIKVFDPQSKVKVSEEIQNRAEMGYRTLAIAYNSIKNMDSKIREEYEEKLIFLGFISILDPPRAGVKHSVQECQEGGIRVIMITGDHPATAKTIAKQMNIYKLGDLVVEGNNIPSLSMEDFNNVSVFARVNPSDKEIIVRNYQDQNKICAMTGDGINDALALKLSNAGIAMGITGTDIAKETADMVVSDDNFTSIEKGVKIGRGLFSKIRSIIYFFICINIMEAIIFFAYEFIPGFELFSSEWQHIYIFAILHSFPSLALVIDKHPKDVMKEPPRNEEQLLNKNMWGLLLFQAFLMGIGLVMILELSLAHTIPLNEWNLNPVLSYFNPMAPPNELVEQKARTMFITTLYIVEITFIWTFRRPNKSVLKSVREEFSLVLLIISIFTLGLHVLHILFSYQVNFYVNEVFGLNFQINFMFLSISDWLLCILFASPGIIGIELIKMIARTKNIVF